MHLAHCTLHSAMRPGFNARIFMSPNSLAGWDITKGYLDKRLSQKNPFLPHSKALRSPSEVAWKMRKLQVCLFYIVKNFELELQKLDSDDVLSGSLGCHLCQNDPYDLGIRLVYRFAAYLCVPSTFWTHFSSISVPKHAQKTHQIFTILPGTKVFVPLTFLQ